MNWLDEREITQEEQDCLNLDVQDAELDQDTTAEPFQRPKRKPRRKKAVNKGKGKGKAEATHGSDNDYSEDDSAELTEVQ